VVEPGMVASGPPQLMGRRTRSAGGVASGAADMTGNAPSAAPAPAQAAAERFEAAKAAAVQRDARSLAAADSTVMSSGDVRRGGRRIFRRDGDRWMDVGMRSELRVYKVKAYSQAYFALLEKLPELREAFAVGDRMVVAGRSAAVEVVDDAPELTESELSTIVKNW
jgi:Ca-activated chloride channel homolog